MQKTRYFQWLQYKRNNPSASAAWFWVLKGYRGTSLMRNSAPLGPYSRTIPGALRWSRRGVAVSYDRGTIYFFCTATMGIGAVVNEGLQGYLAH